MTDPRLAALFATPVEPAQLTSRVSAHPKHGLVQQCLTVLDEQAQVNDNLRAAYFVPGRIEVFGKHTDYCGGRSLLCAVDRGFAVVVRKRNDRQINLTDARMNETVEFSLEELPRPPEGHWSTYPMVVARRVQANFGDLPLVGADIVVTSDLPPAAGLSSSSAFIIGVFLALAGINQLHRAPQFVQTIQTLEDLAHYCGCIENGSSFDGLSGISGVGTHGGSQDHTAILCCRAGTISQYGFSPVKHEQDIAFPSGLAMVVLNSGVVAQKTGSAMHQYNAASHKVRELVGLWNSATNQDKPTLASIVRSSPSAADELMKLIQTSHLSFSPDDLALRLRQFVDESETIIPQAAQALIQNDLPRLAQLVQRSTAGAIEKLRNQEPRTIELIDAALKHGALAASPFGAGFGGSAWAMVYQGQLAEFVRDLQPIAAGVFPVQLTDGARMIG